MGGFGSGKGSRYGKISTRKRLYTGEVDSIDIRSLTTDNFETLRQALKSQGICSDLDFKRHAFRTGGVWYTFRCPICCSGRRTLYLSRGRFGCHKCLGLAYWSENRGKSDRAIRMKWNYVRKISSEADHDQPARPKGMHRKTYDKLMGKVSHYDQEALRRFMWFGNWGTPKRPI